MGLIQHNAIIVTHFDDGEMRKCYEKALEIFGDRIHPPTKPATNGYSSLFIPPDGSKEGWDESNLGDLRRANFLLWIEASGFFFHWVEVCWGENPAYISGNRDD